MHKNVLALANKARTDMERMLQDLYHRRSVALTGAYKDRHIPDSSNLRNLECYCAVSSRYLQLLGKKHGVRIEFVMGLYLDGFDSFRSRLSDINSRNKFDNNHCWNEIDGQIIDITATQFGIADKIYQPETKEAYVENYRNGSAVRFMNKSWPMEQRYRPFEKLLKNLSML